MKTKIVNNVAHELSDNTPDQLVEVLEKLSQEKIRVTIDYGNTETGRSWNETHNISGYISKSTGTLKLFILVNNSRSIGGGAVLTGSILSIRHANKKSGSFIYKHS